MTTIVALCGASASGKSVLAKSFVEKDPKKRVYIATTTAKVRERYNSPTYAHLCSFEGNALMFEYQRAIAINLWEELLSAFEIAKKRPKLEYIVLDRSPMDAYIYECMFDVKRKSASFVGDSIAFRATQRFFFDVLVDYCQIENYGQKLAIVGVTSYFDVHDDKRPNKDLNLKYVEEVKRIFGAIAGSRIGNTFFRQLSNSTLEANGRCHLLHNILKELPNEDSSTKR